ncbi:hypothetical protein D3C80_1851070 [compost metagenome]
MDRLALQAEMAMAARLRGIDGDELAECEPADAFAQRLHPPRCLMAADDRLAHPHRPEAAVLIIM